MEALLAAFLALAPMSPDPGEVGPRFLVCVRRPDAESLECVEYDQFTAALKAKLLEISPKRGEI